MINIENNGSDSEILHNCRLCPRRCGADRLSGQRGFCLAGGETVRLGRAALHFYEEPCISGEKGSGAVFFSGCNMRCDYCQNGSLSRGFCGVDIMHFKHRVAAVSDGFGKIRTFVRLKIYIK